MSQYRRADAPGATYFFTVVTYDRKPWFNNEKNVAILREGFRDIMVKRPFIMEAVVVLPDHLHCLWRLPQGDNDFSGRWREIKKRFLVSLTRAPMREKNARCGNDAFGSTRSVTNLIGATTSITSITTPSNTVWLSGLPIGHGHHFIAPWLKDGTHPIGEATNPSPFAVWTSSSKVGWISAAHQPFHRTSPSETALVDALGLSTLQIKGAGAAG
jgi:REP element-mobilizing transposase RayT